MSNELKELMQISIIGENKDLSNMLADIIPIKEQRFTDLELEAEKKETFSIVLYKKENPIVRFFKGIKMSLEKFRIMGKSREIDYARNQNR
ncbi:MAG: hypothetical protein ACLR4X_02120 [Clostridia bacterium]|jgi:hypothetical protein